MAQAQLEQKSAPRSSSKEPLLVTHLSILPGGSDEPLTDGALLIHGGKIIALGPTSVLKNQHEEKARIINGLGYTAIPGLVNAHTHVAMGFFRGLGQGRKNMIESFFFPAEKALTPDLLEALSYSYIYAGLKKGVTTFGDHYYFIEGVGRALDRFGVRGVIGETIADLGGAFPGRESLSRMEKLLSSWPYSSRITPAICPHAADTVSTAFLTELAELAQSHNLPLHMHLSQTAGEKVRVMSRAGMSPVAYAKSCGALSEKTQAVHLVSATDDDIKILKDHGVTVGLSPASQILYEELAPIASFLAAGLPLALGTDCAASNDDADMLSEMRLLSLLAKDRKAPPETYEADRIFAIGTEGGAHALGLKGKVGRLQVGYAADVVFLAEDLGTLPASRPYINLLFSMGGSKVRHVMVEGDWVLWQGEPTKIDASQLKEAYLAAAGEIKRRIGQNP